MKILEVTVRFKVGTKEEASAVAALLGIGRRDKDIPTDKGVKEEGPVAYTPSSDRTKAASEVLSKCKRVAVLRLEVLDTWANAYPHVDMAGEIMKCEAWAESKGVTRTPRGWQKALNSWLSKAQDSTRGSGMPQVASKPISAPMPVEPETDAWLKAAA